MILKAKHCRHIYSLALRDLSQRVCRQVCLSLVFFHIFGYDQVLYMNSGLVL